MALAWSAIMKRCLKNLHVGPGPHWELLKRGSAQHGPRRGPPRGARAPPIANQNGRSDMTKRRARHSGLRKHESRRSLARDELSHVRRRGLSGRHRSHADTAQSGVSRLPTTPEQNDPSIFTSLQSFRIGMKSRSGNRLWRMTKHLGARLLPAVRTMAHEWIKLYSTGIT